MMRSIIGFAGALALAGCLGQPATSPLSEGPVVSWGNSGSIHGGYRVSIDANEMVSKWFRAGNGEITETDYRAPSGTFATVEQAAMTALQTLDVHAATPTCLDSGTTYIERSTRRQQTQRVEAMCPEPKFDSAITDLNALIAQNPSITE